MSTLFLTLSLFVFFPLCKGGDHGAEVKGMFVFGSSLVDNGNNNFIENTSARADYLPYGIDSPLGASGRFSNGRNSIDVLGELLKLHRPIPPFADPRTKGSRIVHGVNYASGGSGILDQTGSITGQVISLHKQIRNFETTTILDLKAQLDRNQTLSHHLSKVLFVVGTGGNDYLLNYFNPGATNTRTSLTNFTQKLISTLSSELQKLYDHGGRKFALFSIQPIGCVPVVRTKLGAINGSCIEAIDQAALHFNSNLRSLVQTSKITMPGSNMVFINSYKIVRDIIDKPSRNGFSDANGACCELSPNNGGGNGVLCQRGGSVCRDRAAHVFFDGLHPTDIVNARIARKAYKSNVEAEVYPINVKQLAQL